MRLVIVFRRTLSTRWIGRTLSSRRIIGWSATARRKNIRLLAHNMRFVILPGAKVPHVASHILGRMASVLSGDWALLGQHLTLGLANVTTKLPLKTLHILNYVRPPSPLYENIVKTIHPALRGGGNHSFFV